MPYLTEKTRHPLYDLFRSLREKGKGCPKDFLPLPPEMILDVNSSRRLSVRDTENGSEKMGCLILAGGQGTRFDGEFPKGLTPLPSVPPKTLFQLLFEKILAKGKNLSVTIMTSPFTHDATTKYLEEHDWFGLEPAAVEFLQQDVFPICDEKGYLVEAAKSDVVEAPDGNGKAFSLLLQEGIWEKWRQRGIEFVQVIPIDNPLANPFDEELLAIYEKEGVELVLRAIERDDPKEGLGIVGVQNGRLSIQEYSEWDDRKGYSLGNTGLFSCSMDFIQRVAGSSLPWHLAHKKHKGKWIWKFEKFIFDLFPYADSYRVLLSDRKKCFAPLKEHPSPR